MSSHPDRICQYSQCNRVIPRFMTRYAARKYCSNSCAVAAQKERADKKRALEREQRGSAACARCGEDITELSGQRGKGNTKYCLDCAPKVEKELAEAATARKRATREMERAILQAQGVDIEPGQKRSIYGSGLPIRLMLGMDDYFDPEQAVDGWK